LVISKTQMLSSAMDDNRTFFAI